MLSATKHLLQRSCISQTLMNTRNVSSLMKNVSFLVKSRSFSLLRLQTFSMTVNCIALTNALFSAELQSVQSTPMQIQVSKLSASRTFHNVQEIFHHSYLLFFLSSMRRCLCNRVKIDSCCWMKTDQRVSKEPSSESIWERLIPVSPWWKENKPRSSKMPRELAQHPHTSHLQRMESVWLACQLSDKPSPTLPIHFTPQNVLSEDDSMIRKSWKTLRIFPTNA